MHLDGIEASKPALGGAAAHQLARSDITDEVQHQLTIDAGMPTERFPDGSHIQNRQRHPKSHRYYTARSNGVRGGGAGAALSRLADQQLAGGINARGTRSSVCVLPVADREARFYGRVTTRIMNTDESPTRDAHRKHVLLELGSSEPNATKTICGVHITNAGDDSPARGASQDAAAQSVRFAKIQPS